MNPKYHVLITDAHHKNFQVEKETLEKIGAKIHIGYCKDEEELLEISPHMDALLVSYVSIGEKAMNHFKKCKVMVKYGIGIDNIDISAATKRKIFVSYVPDYCTEEVSTHAMALLLALIRKIIPFNNSVKNGIWDPLLADPIYRMEGKTLGIIGFGRNGQRLAQKMQPFHMNIIASDPAVDPNIMAQFGVKKVKLNTLLAQSHYITIHCPLNQSTYHLINQETIDMMKGSVFLVNTSRGAVIDQSALYKALEVGKIAGAALDVLENEPPNRKDILKMNNIIYTPHVSWHSEEAEKNLRKEAALEVKRVLQGKIPVNLVNREVLDNHHQ